MRLCACRPRHPARQAPSQVDRSIDRSIDQRRRSYPVQSPTQSRPPPLDTSITPSHHHRKAARMYPRPPLLRRLASAAATATARASHFPQHQRLLRPATLLQPTHRPFAAAAAAGGASMPPPPPPPRSPPSPPPPPAAAGAPAAAGGAGGTAKPPAPAPPSSNASSVELTDQNLEAVISRSPVPVVLDCYADWCEPCKKLTPVLETLVRCVLAAVNTADHPSTSFHPQCDINSNVCTHDPPPLPCR